MATGKKKMLPEVVTGAMKDEIDLENGFTLEFKLKLTDSNGQPITSFKATDNDTKAILSVYITNTGNTKFPDPAGWLTYRFASTGWLEKDAQGDLKFPQDKEKELQERINKMNGDFVKRYGKEHFSKVKGGRTNPKEGLKNTDMEYRIETNDTPSVPGSPGIRIDVYPTGDTTRKPITEDKVKIDLILNKKIQTNLEKDGLIPYSVPPSNSKLKRWQISLIVLAALAGLAIVLWFIFQRRIKDWWKKRKTKKEDQLEVF